MKLEFLVIVSVIFNLVTSNVGNLNENTSQFWIKKAQNQLHEKLLNTDNKNVAKNIILFLGDGMSVPTLAASRIYLGQKEGKTGEASELSFEKFPYVGLSKTYCVDKQVADSACSATAYLGGVKGNYATIGVNGNVKLNDCFAGQNKANHVKSIAALAREAGKSTGFATTTRVTHASPAGTYAHTSNRDLESDYDIWIRKQSPDYRPSICPNAPCTDIASQLVYGWPGDQFNVILGGGRAKFLPKGKNAGNGQVGERLDGKDLIKEWEKQKKCLDCAKVVNNCEELMKVNYDKVDYLLGLFNADHMNFNLDNLDGSEPSLTEMTEAAIKMLSKNKNGFFLFVEGGKIDIAHHQNLARKALDETKEFSKAIQKAVDLTSLNDTLIIVTADHGHTMSFAGYPKRGNNILGLTEELSPIDHLPYTTLSYANGPGYKPEKNHSRYNLTKDDFSYKNYVYPAAIPLDIETHGGEDVAVFATGPWAKLFTGIYEQNSIPHMISFASCLGDGITLCSPHDKSKI